MNEFDAYKAGPSQDALRALLVAQGDTVYNVCYQVLRDRAKAEDVAQQVLLDLVKQLPKIRDAAHLKAWVSRASFHAALDLKKQDRRRAAHERRTAEMRETPGLTPEQVDAVHSEIARLDDDLRTVVVEHYFERRPLKDLAADRALSEVAVWKRLQKAKERLRASLASTGFAAALLGLDSLLEALEPVRAPEGLVGPGLWTQVGAGASTPLLLAGGIAMNIKVIVGAGVLALLLVAGLGYAVLRQRERRSPEASPSASRGVDRPSAAGATQKPASAPVVPPVAVTEVPEQIQVFTSFMGYYEALMKASFTVDLAERTRAFRRVGILISETQMAAISKSCPFRPGTEEFSKHILNETDRVWKERNPQKALAMVRGFTDLDDKIRKQLIRRLFETWARTDPEAARVNAASLSEGEGRSAVLLRIAAPKTAPEDFARLGAVPEGPDRSEAVRLAIAALAGSDLAAALRTIEGLEPGPMRTEALQALAREWGTRDLAGAVAWLESTTNPEKRQTLLMYVVSGAAERNPRAAADAILKYQDFKHGLGMTTVYTLVSSWSKTDPAASARFLDQIPRLQGRTNVAVQELSPRWGATDPVEALVWAQQQPEKDRGEIVNAVLKGWVKSPRGNFSEAREMVRHLPEALRPKALETVVIAWGEIDPPAAVEFALQETPAVLRDVVARWVQRDEAASLAWIRSLSDVAARDKALFWVSQVFLQMNPVKGVAMAQEIQGAETRDKLLGEIARSTAEVTGIEAGLEILRKIGDPKVRDDSLERLIRRVSQEDPRKAVGLADMISDPAKRTRSFESILTFGSEVDPEACRVILSKLPRVSSIDYQRVAGGFAKKDPVAAATWALTLPEKQMDPGIGEPTQEHEARPRDSALNSVVNAWATSDPDAAVRWIKQASLPESMRSSLLGVVKFQRDHRERR